MYVKRTNEARSCNNCCRGKTVSIILCVFAALVIQHAKRMCPFILTSMACPALRKMGYFDFLYTFLILRRIQRDIINEHEYSREVPVILDGF